MASIDSLPPDQRAVLELVLRRGRSYDEIADLLSIDRAGVRERALAALDALGPQTRVPSARRALITDYLLGALPERVAPEVHDHLAASASERAWARAVASELQPLASGTLPEIPAETRSRTRPAEVFSAGAAVAAASPEPPAVPQPPPDRPSSRIGGAVLLAGGAVVVVAVVLVLVLAGGGASKKPATSASRTPTTNAQASPTTTSTTSTGAQVVAQINLKPPSGATSPVGIAEVLRAQGKIGIAIVAQGLAANSKHPPNAYAVWLYNTPTDSQILGFVNPAVGSNGRLQTAGGLPTNASHYQKLLVTLETQSKPQAPGQIVLEGALTGL
jgi:sigma-70-like protein